jgi:hypothetical protein
MNDGKCVQRALEAGFRFAGCEVPALHESISKSANLKSFCESKGLEIYENKTLACNDRPVLAVYEVPDEYDLSNSNFKKYHAVFCSDAGPVTRYNVMMIIMGWENLNGKKL